MSSLDFTRNDWPTIGVEIEVQLIDPETMALKSAIVEVLDRIPEGLELRIKPELMQCYLEINTEVCRSVDDVHRDLTEKIAMVEAAGEQCNTRLFWAATHPFSNWHHQKITPNERYMALVELLQDSARRLVTFGLHVHVGVDSGDKAVMICDRILRHLPTLLALSTNSPFWNGRDTGMHSQRIKIMENLPTAGLPPLMRNWSEFVWLVNHLVATGFINTIREIWWDVRPHHRFGTVEVRICDMPGTLDEVLGISAIIQCLVHALSEEIDTGTYQHDCHPMMVRQNKWRACRYGMSSELINPYTQEKQPARQVVRELVEHLAGTARQLGCTDYLAQALRMSRSPTGSERQRAIFEQTGRTDEVVRRLLHPGNE